jgi:DNA primase
MQLERAPGYFLWLADQARRKHDMSTAEGKMQGLEFLMPAIKKISGKLERATVANEVAEYLGIERGLVLDEFRKTAVDRQVSTRPVAQSIPNTQRVLLRSLIASEEVRQVLVPKLMESGVTEKLMIRPVLEKIFVLHGEGERFGYAELEAQLEERFRKLLEIAVFADGSEEIFTREQAMAYLQLLEREEGQAQLAGLRANLKHAERAGDMEEAFRLMRQINELHRGLQGR